MITDLDNITVIVKMGSLGMANLLSKFSRQVAYVSRLKDMQNEALTPFGIVRNFLVFTEMDHNPMAMCHYKS